MQVVDIARKYGGDGGCRTLVRFRHEPGVSLNSKIGEEIALISA